MALCAELTKQFDKRALTIDFIGSGGNLERDLVEAQGLRYHAIRSGKFRRYGRGAVRELLDFKTLGLNTRDAWRFSRGLSDARRLLKDLQPDVVFVKGGFVGLPVGFAARRLGIPLVLHESDVVMGLTNRLLASRAQAIGTGFPVEAYTGLKSAAQLVHVGNPVRHEITKGDRRRARREFGLRSAKPTVLIIGGSSGAQAVNEIVFQALVKLLPGMNIIHQVGSRHIDAAFYQRQRLPKDVRDHYSPHEFLKDELADAYALADVVVSRCGANVLAELALLRKPTLLIPLPSSANNHQVKNAEFVAKLGAARVLSQNELTPRRFRARLEALVESVADQKYLSQSIRRFAEPDANRKLAALLIDVAEHKDRDN